MLAFGYINAKRKNIWTDKWVYNLIIQDYVNYITPELLNLRVMNLINQANKNWNLDKIRHIGPEFIINKLLNLQYLNIPTKINFNEF